MRNGEVMVGMAEENAVNCDVLRICGTNSDNENDNQRELNTTREP